MNVNRLSKKTGRFGESISPTFYELFKNPQKVEKETNSRAKNFMSRMSKTDQTKTC